MRISSGNYPHQNLNVIYTGCNLRNFYVARHQLLLQLACVMKFDVFLTIPAFYRITTRLDCSEARREKFENRTLTL